MELALGKRKRIMINDDWPQVASAEEGCRLLIAGIVTTAVLDALGQGMTGRNREGIVESAWAYLESTMFRQDLELMGCLVDVDLFLRELRELAKGAERQGGKVAELQCGKVAA